MERFDEMSIVEDLIEQNPDDGEKIFAYISNPRKTQLVSGVNLVSLEMANEDMLMVKRMYNKLAGRQFIHFVQSFSPEENVTPELVHEIGLKLAEFEGFKGFQMVVATHVDAQHLHNHFVINTVNAETGLKWQQSRRGLQQLKEYSDEICQAYGLSMIPWKNQERKPPGEYRAEERGDSWKHELRLAVKECLRNSINQADFISNMERLGYKVNWSVTRKYVTFTTPDGMNCRNIRLGQEFDKEKMLKALELNKRYSNHRELHESMDTIVNMVKSPVSKVKSIDEQQLHQYKNIWKAELQLVVRESLQNSINRKEFVANMARFGYKVNWSDTRKYVTFTTPDGKKCRNVRLGQEFDKEKMLKELELNGRHYNHKELRDTMDSLVKALRSPGSINGLVMEQNIWREELKLAIRGTIGNSTTKDEFITNMRRFGYEVVWVDRSEYILFRTANGKKCRSESLGKFYEKDNLQKIIESNRENTHNRMSHARMELCLELFNFLGHRINIRNNNTRYPLSASLEGQNLRDKIAEEQLGDGLDWNKGEGYER